MVEVAAEGRECVLVVEDEQDAREMMRELVELGGCSALLAANGAEALTLLSSSSRRPCLIVLDLLMPVMDGAHLLDELRRKPELATIPVVIATAAPHQAPSGTAVLPKPIDIATLWGWMRRSCHCTVSMPAIIPS
jgi:CheY-like chemotaxis protein